MKKEIKKLLEREAKEFLKEPFVFSVETQSDRSRGDYSTNVALVVGKRIGKNPLEVANLIAGTIQEKNIFKKVEVVNGFINFFLKEEYLQKELKRILKEKDKFGSSKIGKNQKINLEFISANPTGPLTLGNGRGGFGGDVLANVLKKTGYKVTKEYYINDIGVQIKKLGHSVIGDAEAVYKGSYIEELRKNLDSAFAKASADKIGEKSAKAILEKMIRPSVKKMGLKFDVWFSEKNLYKKKEVDKAIEELNKKGFTYESEGALWFKSKDLGDDKDRVLVRADGVKTYFASDIAYLKNKFKRKFAKLIIFLGADHYGYVARLRAAAEAMGFDKNSISPLVLQLVRLFENGKEVRMSKRTGIYVTIDELIDEVGLDITRFFFLQRSLDTHFNFDMDLAKERSEKNPVFKVQYAYARISSILNKFGKAKIQKPQPKILNLLKEESELYLIKELIRFPEIVEDTARDYQLQRLPQYSLKLSEAFHAFYEKCRVITEDKDLTSARISLILATKINLKNVLGLMGITAPERMPARPAGGEKKDETQK